MAAATQDSAKLVAALKDKFAASGRNMEDGNLTRTAIEVAFEDSHVIPTTAIDDVNDILRFHLCPSGTFITDLRGTISDVDTNATPTFVYDIILVNAAGVTQYTLVSASTKGQAGGTDRLRDAAVGVFAGDFYLALKTTTASATPAAGTYKLFFKLCSGMHTYAAGIQPQLTDPQI